VCGGTHPGFLQAMAKRPGWADRRQIELERRCYAHARYIVAHSRRMREELLRYYDLPADKIDVLYPPVDASRFKPLDAQQRLLTRARLGLPADRVVFLLVSTGHARKGWAELQAVFAQTRLPITLAVAGRPLPHAAANVVELGYRADIETVFAAADFTVVASRYEPFGLVAVESVLCGTPVVIADTVGSAEVLGENAKIGYSLQTPDGLSAAIAAAYRRAQQGQHRIDAPRSALRYDPGVKTHVDALLLRFAACAQS
ncbi:MAG: glycosyltransferase, partial [Thiomonas sp.]